MHRPLLDNNAQRLERTDYYAFNLDLTLQASASYCYEYHHSLGLSGINAFRKECSQCPPFQLSGPRYKKPR